VLASTGSTCSRAGLPSRVLQALGVPADQARGSLVFCVDGTLDDDALKQAVRITAEEVRRLRAMAPAVEARDIVSPHDAH